MVAQDLNFASEAVHGLLGEVVPDMAPDIAPFVDRLFAALAEGHSFVDLNAKETAVLQKAYSVVGVGGDSPLILDGNKLFLGKMWRLEYDLAQEIMRLAQARPVAVDEARVSHYLDQWFSDDGSREQKVAAALSVLQNFMVISGGPGTGKTTTVAKLLALLCVDCEVLPRIALTAPTGKAAAHMTKALHRALGGLDVEQKVLAHLYGLEGQTVHRLLKLRPPYMESLFNADNPLPLDILVLDEASMLDAELLLQLLTAIPSGCKVILLGDENQLPSVGAGAVLAEIARNSVLDANTAGHLTNVLSGYHFEVSDRHSALSGNIARLSVSHRFDDRSGIGCLARAVVKGKVAEALAQFDRFPDAINIIEDMSDRQQLEAFYHLQQPYWEAVAVNHVEAAFRHQTDIMVLAAWRRDAERFNQAYRAYLQQIGVIKNEGRWFPGQVVMINRNDYTVKLFNGDIGLIMKDIEAGIDALVAYFPDGMTFRKIALSRLPDCEMAFAMTVHKSQGSEYREVWLLPPSGDEMVLSSEGSLTKALLYTALTRARERFVFLGDHQLFTAACAREEKRRSALRDRLEAISASGGTGGL
ncbi:MAG: exodeoxyribonuclease V subunit alpha [Neisseria sp.]|uniref:exodeoxyribonuclease V subunit alpha n=1 Tax=Neisseria sp. TaxID=192066 RepID=UPI0026DD4CE4|nr:exodeoxyribonuclease V subunit alpha [Neisseria sp.]MDO4640886.1 exodeoxyribonuclease V subunit alpha [Neisseria sp.]